MMPLLAHHVLILLPFPYRNIVVLPLLLTGGYSKKAPTVLMKTSFSRRQLLQASARSALLLSPLAFVANTAIAAKPRIYTGKRSNLALSGYDPVNYFREGEPSKGNKNHSIEYLGADWRFINPENLTRFRDDPEAYLPEYGGYCAFSVAQGKLVKGDPTLWVIDENNRLFINFNRAIHRMWVDRMEFQTAKADKNWPSILG